MRGLGEKPVHRLAGCCCHSGWGLGTACLPAVNSPGPQFSYPENGNDNTRPVYQCGWQSNGPPERRSDVSREPVTASASLEKGTVRMRLRVKRGRLAWYLGGPDVIVRDLCSL